MSPSFLIAISFLSTLMIDDVKGGLVYSRKNKARTTKKVTSIKVTSTKVTSTKVTTTSTERQVFPWNTLQYYETIGPPGTETFIQFIRNPNGTDPIYFYPNRTAEETAAMIAKRKGRAHNNHWCRCGFCPAMSTDEDSVCCRDDYYFNRLVSELEGSRETICYADIAMTYLALRRVDLEEYRVLFLPAHKRNLENVYNVDFRNKTQRLWRWLAYRYIIRGLNLVTPYDQGRFNETVPACVVAAVRGEYPEPDNKYPDTGWSVFQSIRLPG